MCRTPACRNSSNRSRSSGLTVGAGRSVDLLFDRHAHDVGVTVLDRVGEVGVIVTT